MGKDFTKTTDFSKFTVFFFLHIYSHWHLGDLKRCSDLFTFTVLFTKLDNLLYFKLKSPIVWKT